MNGDKLVKVIVSQRIIRNAFRKYVLQSTSNSSFSLNSNELMTLFYLRAFEGLTQKEMSVYLDYDLATAGRILNSMAKKGVITRVKSKEDARRNDIALTEKGEKVLATLFELAKKWWKENTQGITGNDEETEQANNQIIELAKRLTKNWGATDEWKE